MDFNELSRRWFDFATKNQDKVNCNHTAVFFLCIDMYHRDRRGDRFSIWTETATKCLGEMDELQLRKTIDDLAAFGFIDIVFDSAFGLGWVLSFKCNTIFNYILNYN